MTNAQDELFWFIRPNDSIVIYSHNEDIRDLMRGSRNTGEFHANSCPDKKVDLFLFDKNISPCTDEMLSLINKQLLPDGKVILHNSYVELIHKLIEDGFMQEAVSGEYVIFTADFIKNYDESFYHNEFEKYFKALNTNLCSFSRDYHNPYIYRNIVQMGGSRLRNDGLLKECCVRIIETYSDNSPDKGGALCVLGYRYYMDGVKDDSFLKELEQYCENNLDSNNPHVVRWIISLYYLIAINYQNIFEDNNGALEYFKKSYETDFRKFNGLICTKQVAACGNIGYIYLSQYNDVEKAKQWFKNGIERAKQAVHFDFDNMVGKDGCYIPFGFAETAELCDIASQCVFAYNNTDLYFRNKKLFDTMFNRVRFGLVTRCQKLEKELEELKSKMGNV